MRVRAGERVTRLLHLARRHPGRNDRHGREGGRARRSSRFPMAISAVSNAELARLGTQTVGSGRCARTVSHVFPEHRVRSAHDPRDRGQRRCYAGSDPSSAMYLDGVYLARPAMAFVQFLDLGSHRSASRAAGHLVWTQRGRWGDEPDLQGRPRTTSRRPPISPPGTSASFAPTRGSAARSNATG